MNIAARQSLIQPLAQLYPLPGSKAAKKYDLLIPDPDHVAICQPFMGSAARSLGSPLPSYLGDINAAHRSIAAAHKSPTAFCHAYNTARDRLIEGIDRNLLANYSNQGPIKADHPEVCQLITDRWQAMLAELFADRHAESPELAGRYYFALKTTFGQVMRLNPTGTKYNCAWHIDKLNGAIAFDPAQWCIRMALTPFDAQIYPDWQSAIAAPPNPENTLLIIDPPYCVDGSINKITSCYPGMSINYTSTMGPELGLAIDPLKQAIELGYRTIYLCNYRSTQLEEAIEAATQGAIVTRHDMGECGALGNSNGRLIHGDRKDGRDRPVQAIWEIRFSEGRTVNPPKNPDNASVWASASGFGGSNREPSEKTINANIEAAIDACSLEVDRLKGEGVARPMAWIAEERSGDRTYHRIRWEEGNRQRSKSLRKADLPAQRQKIANRNRMQFFEFRIAELQEFKRKLLEAPP